MSAEDMQPAPELTQHRETALVMLDQYQQKRINWYDSQKLGNFIHKKDVTMFVARGITTATEYMYEAFRAYESSSEETVMGTLWQNLLTAISADTMDMGDITTVRDGDLWVVELKAQTNTVNSSSLAQEVRTLKHRVQQIDGRHRPSGQRVRAALCVMRDGVRGKDEIRHFPSSDVQTENRDIIGFEYRYITGPKFWQWLAGYDNEIGLLLPLSDIDGSAVRAARERCIERLRKDLLDELSANGLSDSIDDLVALRDKLNQL